MATVEVFLLQHDRRGRGHSHDLGLDLDQPWIGLRLLRWWRLGFGRETLGFV
jgi:hypothetical protein